MAALRLRNPFSACHLDRVFLRQTFPRRVVLCASFVLTYFVLARSGVILEQKLGTVVWYPALGLGCALTLGLTPTYAPLLTMASCSSPKKLRLSATLGKNWPAT